MKPTIILIAGKKQSGKNTVADYIQAKYDYVQMSFAEELKEQVCEYIASLGIDYFENGEVFNDEEIKKQIIPYKHNKKKRTYRELLQWWGTEFTREFFNDNIWAEVVAENIKELWSGCNIVISDWRFENEFLTIKEAFKDTHDIITIKIQRNSCDTTDSHISEKALDDFKFDYVLTNNGTKEELYDKIDLLFDCIDTQKADEIDG